MLFARWVATFLVSTSNRNSESFLEAFISLLHFLFLHQTATCYYSVPDDWCCYISCFYIKPQLEGSPSRERNSCYISCFYIKPQPILVEFIGIIVATFLVSTSNRNLLVFPFQLLQLLHFLFLHQTATESMLFLNMAGCYISCFYIKPQRNVYYSPEFSVATFLVSTSNRNCIFPVRIIFSLLHFLFLHQTATRALCFFSAVQLLHFLFLHQTATQSILILHYIRLLHFLFLHQTATCFLTKIRVFGCYISCFYIKPQPKQYYCCFTCVATFLVSTSNRNSDGLKNSIEVVATFLVSTSNRNSHQSSPSSNSVATFLVSTSNRNHTSLYLVLRKLLHFLFLHQTATFAFAIHECWCCYISCFYIKPQL